MKRGTYHLLRCIAIPGILILATTGCATKKYVAKKVDPVSQRVDVLETQTNQKFTLTDEKIAALNDKHASDISQVNERITTDENKLGLASTAAQKAETEASEAMKQSQANSAKISANSAAVTTLSQGVANALNYQEVQKADVTFDFDKATLTPDAKAALNEVAAKVGSLPRAMVEVVGFTDPIGSEQYNLELSHKRAEAVQRYLVSQKVPLHTISIVGLGEEAPPPGLEADLAAIDPNATQAEKNRLARRVHVRVFGAGDIVQTTATGGNSRQ